MSKLDYEAPATFVTKPCDIIVIEHASVRQSVLSRLNRLTLIFDIGVDLDLGHVGILGQRSKVGLKVKDQGQGQRLWSRSRVKIKFLACSGQY